MRIQEDKNYVFQYGKSYLTWNPIFSLFSPIILLDGVLRYCTSHFGDTYLKLFAFCSVIVNKLKFSSVLLHNSV